MRGAPYAKLEPVNVRKGQEMALTEYEKKVLEQMEASLREEDPALASQMSAPAPAEETESESQRGPRAPRRIALGFAGAVLGMVLLVVAVSLGYSIVSILIGVVGFAVTVAGILYALSRPASPSDTSDRPRRKKNKENGGWDSFIQDQERRWDDRKNDD